MYILFKNSVFFSPVTRPSVCGLLMDAIAVCSQKHTKHVNVPRDWETIIFFNIKAVGVHYKRSAASRGLATCVSNSTGYVSLRAESTRDCRELLSRFASTQHFTDINFMVSWVGGEERKNVWKHYKWIPVMRMFSMCRYGRETVLYGLAKQKKGRRLCVRICSCEHKKKMWYGRWSC